MTYDALLDHLHEKRLIRVRDAHVESLTGGVSSEILLIDDGASRFVLKRALAKLRVKDDWFADVSRNHYEQEYMRYVGGFLPQAVPRILHSDPEHGFFTMEYLGDGYANWKKLLLDGHADPAHAEQAGRILGTIHSRSWGNAELRRRFDTTRNFYQLRIESYLITTGKRHPPLREHFDAEADRIAGVHLCLVHGDYSPKNILIGDGRLVVLDCEVAWFGEPAFDVAFLCNHFMLKALLHHRRPGPFLDLVQTAWSAYRARLAPDQSQGLEHRIARLMLMLMLARVDGKSPVEYLTEERKRDLIRTFVGDLLPADPSLLTSVVAAWCERIESLREVEEAVHEH